MTVKVEAQTLDGEWADLTKYVKGGVERRDEFLAGRGLALDGRGRRVGLRTMQRRAALAERRRNLAHLLDTYGPSANPTVAAVRAQTETNEHDRAMRLRGGAGGRGPTHPNRRLTAFGMRVVLDGRGPDGYRLAGGTARQQACYRRAVKRWLIAGAGA